MGLGSAWGQEYFGAKSTLGSRALWGQELTSERNEVGKENLTTVMPTGPGELPVQGGTGRGGDPQREEARLGPSVGWQLGSLLVWVDQAVCCLHGHTGFTWPTLGGLMRQFTVDRPQAGAHPPFRQDEWQLCVPTPPPRTGQHCLLGPMPCTLFTGSSLASRCSHTFS